MPAHVSIDDVVGWNDVDEFHRYELSPKGVLLVVPVPADHEHSGVLTDLMYWLGDGLGRDQRRRVRQNEGIRTPTGRGTGYRVPDLIVLRDNITPPPGPLDGGLILLAVEAASPSTEDIDKADKVREYAEAGVEHYWLIARDARHTVTRRVQDDNGRYGVHDDMPLAWILNQDPAELLR